MNSFRFGLWVGFVAGIVFAALWDNEPEEDREKIEDQGSKIDEGSSEEAFVH
jgi:hypothetical protein